MADGDSAVPFRAEKQAGPGWDISRGGVNFGHQVVAAGHEQRVRVKVFKQVGEQVLALTSVSCLCGLSGTRQRQTHEDKPVHTERLATGGGSCFTCVGACRSSARAISSGSN
jgi:hypothetical protein